MFIRAVNVTGAYPGVRRLGQACKGEPKPDGRLVLLRGGSHVVSHH